MLEAKIPRSLFRSYRTVSMAVAAGGLLVTTVGCDVPPDGAPAPGPSVSGSTSPLSDRTDPSIACGNAVDIGFTIRDGNQVKGSASWTRCDSTFKRVEITLFKQVAVGFNSQRILNFDPADFGAHAFTVQKDCRGTGKKKWFTTVRAFDAAGDEVISKQSNTLQTDC
jgi:hypothetical protein